MTDQPAYTQAQLTASATSGPPSFSNLSTMIKELKSLEDMLSQGQQSWTLVSPDGRVWQAGSLKVLVGQIAHELLKEM